MLGVVLAGVGAPLLRAPTFYFWDDTAAASVGGWRTIGAALLHGHLPLLDLDMWRGGNFAAEAAFGVYNPLLLGLYAGTMPIDDLAAVTFVIKAFFFLTMALGAYLLCREYGARPWIGALTGAMLPMSGFTLYMDGAAWVTGLTVTALTPWVWLTAKRVIEGRGSVLWLVLAGYLCGSAGNPYGLLSSAIVIGAVLVEVLARRQIRRALTVVGGGVAVALLCVPTYLPFVLTSSVSYRAAQTTIFNDNVLAPNLSDLLGISSPSFQPYMWGFNFPYFVIPVFYVGWFLLPLLPWLRWPQFLRDLPRLVAPVLVGICYLALVVGPSQVWFFRWPLRLLPYLWLALAVLFARLLSAGLDRSRPGLRWTLSAAAIGAGLWTAWSDRPQDWVKHLAATALVAALFWVLLRVGRHSQRWLALVALVGSLAVLMVQLAWMPNNANTTDFNFPRSQKALTEQYASYRPGLTVQVAELPPPGPARSAQGAYRDMLFGNMYAVAGVESLTAYSGVGFTAFDVPLCSEYQGAMCPGAWSALWRRPKGSDEMLADLLRVQRVVVQHGVVDTTREPPPADWQLSRSGTDADVWTRTTPLAWPQGRVSDVTGPVTVTGDRRTGAVGEQVTLRRDGGGPAHVTFARLAWPGYTAEIDGRPVAVQQGPVGLLTVDLPEGVSRGTLVLSWAPPGQGLSASAALLGVLMALLLGCAEFVRRRRRPPSPSTWSSAVAADEDDFPLEAVPVAAGGAPTTQEHWSS